ncbi:DapH/DapD/GlmU-related protein [Curtobacterium sp. MCLR17_034]|uniref:acyltransferase n=1 Tax=Curtobacterium sp. MCLR17_034 TaxID=2175623 RepID=UPI000DA8551F|nr:acyltransferase [Curtobacterium sp. MCLR17_034]PZF13066.1 acetyltransferase [Curtobacterium sp. MCLR17_034]
MSSSLRSNKVAALTTLLEEAFVASTFGLVHHIIRQRTFPRLLRSRALGALGNRINRTAVINAHVTIAGRATLSVGARTFLNEGIYLDLSDQIVIGEDCAIGHEVLFTTATHRLGKSTRRAGESVIHPIVVGDGTWVGSRATILPGVRIGSGCVVGAGAVVTSDIPNDSIYAGVPARLIRPLDSATESETETRA